MRTLVRIVGIVASVIAALTVAVAPSSAAGTGNPHFNKVSASTSGSDLTVSFKEVGLGSGTTVTIVVSAHWDAQFACYNNGGKHPAATNKESTSGDSSASGQFTSDRNGTISDSLTVSAPTVSSNTFTCPPGQTEILTYLRWSGITVTDSTSPATATVPGTFTFGSMV